MTQSWWSPREPRSLRRLLRQPRRIDSAARVRQQLNGARALAPLYRAVLAHPGLQVERDVFDHAFEEVTHLYQSTLDRVCRAFEVDAHDPPLRAILAAPIAALVGQAWELRSDEANRGLLSAEHLAQLYARIAVLHHESQPSPSPVESIGVGETAAGQGEEDPLAEARALGTVVVSLLPIWVLRPATQRLYVSDQSQEEVIEHIRVTLLERADDIADRLLTEIPPAAARSGVYRGVLAALAELYRYTLEAQFEELSRQIRDMSPGAKKAYLEAIPAHPVGVLIERTEELFCALAPGCYPAIDDVPASQPHSLPELDVPRSHRRAAWQAGRLPPSAGAGGMRRDLTREPGDG